MSSIHHHFTGMENVEKSPFNLWSNTSQRWKPLLGFYIYLTDSANIFIWKSKSFLLIEIHLLSLLIHFNMITFDRIVINSFIIPLFLMDSVMATGRLKWTKSNERDKNFTDDGLHCLGGYWYSLILLEVKYKSVNQDLSCQTLFCHNSTLLGFIYWQAPLAFQCAMNSHLWIVSDMTPLLFALCWKKRRDKNGLENSRLNVLDSFIIQTGCTKAIVTAGNKKVVVRLNYVDVKSQRGASAIVSGQDVINTDILLKSISKNTRK